MNSGKKVQVFIIGAQKAGTTSLYDWFGQHPEINAPNEIKDYHFFSDESLYKKGFSHIENFYKKPGSLNVHAAVNYMYFSEYVAERIHNYNPDAKLIICLRDPVDRAISAYQYFVRTLRENSSFADALNKELNGELATYQERSNNTYIGHGLYLKQIENYLKYFDKENMHFVFFDDLVSAEFQQITMQKLEKFIGVSDAGAFNYSFEKMNASGQPKSQIVNHFLRRSKIRKVIKLFLPFSIRKKLGRFIEQKNISDQRINVLITDHDKKTLEQTLTPQMGGLSKIVGREI